MAKARGRPQSREGEVMVVGNDLLASMISPNQGGVYFLSVDEIIQKKGWSVYREMLTDDQVKTCLAFKKVLVTGRSYDLKPADESDAAKLQAKFVEENFCRINIKRVLKEATSAFEFGYAIAEQVFERDTWDEDGKQYVFLKKLAHRDPKDIQLKIDYNGNFLGARQWGIYQPQAQQKTGSNGIELEPDKLWLYSHEPRFGNIYGTSDLRASYRSWFAKKFVIQFWNVFLERFGSPLTKMTYPTGASEDLKTKLKSILTNLSSKTEVLVPQGVEIELIEATRGGAAGYTDALAFHNNSIARGILMVGLVGANGDATRQQEGDSQSFLHLRILFKLADEISIAIVNSLMNQVVKPLLDMNFEKPLYPEFIWQDYGQFEGMQVADEIRQLHMAGILDMDQEDVNYCRSILGLPLRDEDNEDEVNRPESMPISGGGATTPPAAGQGNTRADKGGSAKKDSTGRVKK